MELYAGTQDGLFRLDGGAPERIAGGDVQALAVEHDGLWLVRGETSLVWMAGAPAGGSDRVTGADRPLRCLLPLPGGLLAGTADAGLVRLEGDRLVEVDAFAATPGREGWYTPWGGPPDTRSLAATPDGTLFANVHVGGIPRSRDAGTTWEPTVDVDADVHQVLTAGDAVVAAAADGLAVSVDGGDSWRWETGGLHATYARAVAVTGGHVLVSVSDGPGGRRSALYAGPVGGGEPLRRCRAGLPEWFAGNVDTHCLVAAHGEVVAADGGALFRSGDAGQTWEALARDLPPVRCLAPATGSA